MAATARLLVPHEAAEIFPMLSPGEFLALKDDIEDHGLRDPVVVYMGKILDGRNRYKACCELDIDPEIIRVDSHDIGNDPIAFVVSANLRRRHLTDAQRSMIAVELERIYSGAAKERMAQGGGDKKSGSAPVQHPIEAKGKAAEQAATVMGVGARSVASAKKVVTDGAKQVADAVRAGQVSVKVAEKLVRSVPDKREQAAIVKQAIASDKPDKAINLAVAPKNPPPQYTISDNALDIVERFVALGHVIKNEYGGMAGMFASRHWDKAETLYFKQQLHALRLLITELDKEASDVK
jgi:hypothetical protein